MKFTPIIFVTTFLLQNTIFAQSKSLKKANEYFQELKYLETNNELKEFSIDFEKQTLRDQKNAEAKKKSSSNVYATPSPFLDEVAKQAAAQRIIDDAQDLAFYHLLKTKLYFSQTNYRNIDSAFYTIMQSEIQLLKLQTLNVKEYSKSCEKYSLCIENVQQLKKSIDDSLFHKYCGLKELSSIETFINKFPQSRRKNEARQLVENIEIERAIASKDLNLIKACYDKYPNSGRSIELLDMMDLVRFENAKQSENIQTLQYFIKNYPSSKYKSETLSLIEKLTIDAAILSKKEADVKELLTKFPQTQRKTEIEAVLEEIAFWKLKSSNDLNYIKVFLISNPNSIYKNEIETLIETKEIEKALQEEDFERISYCIAVFPNNEKINDLNKALAKIKQYQNTIKSYSGDYKKGKATYQYYENGNGERVFHGKFKYEGSNYDGLGDERSKKAINNFNLSYGFGDYPKSPEMSNWEFCNSNHTYFIKGYFLVNNGYDPEKIAIFEDEQIFWALYQVVIGQYSNGKKIR